MTAGSPIATIEETAERWRRRDLLRSVAMAAPPAATLLAALALRRLPLEVAVAGVLALAVFLLDLASRKIPRQRAAELLDAAFGGRDHFLTLATLGPEDGAPLRYVIEEDARRLASGRGAVSFPSTGRRPLFWSVVLSIGLGLALFVLPRAFVPADPVHGLRAIADRFESSASRDDRRLGAELRALADLLRDPQVTQQAKRRAIADVQRKLEQQGEQRAGTASGGSGAGENENGAQSQKQGAQRSPHGPAREPGASAQAHSAGEPGAGKGEAEGRGATGGERTEAGKELSKLAQAQGGESSSDESRKAKGQGEKRESTQEGGGLRGPQDAANERGGEKSGNTPQGAGERRDAAGQAANSEPSSEASGRTEKTTATGERSSGRQPKGAGSGEGGAAGAPSTDGSQEPAERFYRPGEGPQGERIEDGRYVRVRIPEESSRATEMERAEGPGDTEPTLPYGNAPLPEAGKPGEPVETQPRPLEYREALGDVAR